MKKITQIIREYKKVAILSHKKPDGDAIGSSVGLSLILNNLGIDADVIQLDNIPSYLDFIDNTNIKLYSGEKLSESYDCIICVDTADEKRVDDRYSLSENMPLIVIDHHATNTYFGDFNYIFDDYSSTCEIIYDLFKEEEVFDNKIATALYTGISTDTNRFMYDNTSKNTLSVASNLVDMVDLNLINSKLYANKKVEYWKLISLAMQNAKFTYNGKIASVLITKEMQDQANYRDCDSIVEILRDIDSVEISLVVYYYSNSFKASFRTNSDFDVSNVAKIFSGGGHKKAAGATLGYSDPVLIYEDVLKILEEEYARYNSSK